MANLRDVTARKEAETALKESEERFRTLIERAPVAIGIARYGKTIYANAAYQKMFGFQTIEELRGRPIAEQWAPQCREEIEERARQRSLGLPVATEYEAIGERKDGSQFPVHAAATLVQLADGPANIGFLTDITDRKRAEEALRASEKRYRHLFENNLAGVFRSTPDGRMTAKIPNPDSQTDRSCHPFAPSIIPSHSPVILSPSLHAVILSPSHPAVILSAAKDLPRRLQDLPSSLERANP